MGADVTNDTSPDTPTAGTRAVPSSSAGPTLSDPLAEALRMVKLASGRGLHVRLMGGLAFHARCADWTALVERERRDIDLATRKQDRKALTDLMVTEGYTADRQYNALYGHKQLYFLDDARQRPVDVLVDRLEMCHRFDFADRLLVSEVTLPPSDLLLSKLQVVKVNRKDLLDALALLSEYPMAEGDEAGSAISVRRITNLTSNDWGWWRTITGNLAQLRTLLDGRLEPGELDFGRPPRFDPTKQVAALHQAIDGASKSTRWKLRSRVGDRVAWYELPEEVGHGRD